MTLRSWQAVLSFAAAVAVPGVASAGAITSFTNLPAYQAALGGATETVETFGNVARFPISTGVLNSSTNLVVAFGSAITPGLIQPGVTYSTPIGSGNFFNIDFGADYVGGFLDSITNPTDPTKVLTTTFVNPVSAFGFVTSRTLNTSLNITINFTSGPAFQANNIAIPSGGMMFFGWQSAQADIVSAVIDMAGAMAFAVDDFRFATSAATVPEPGTLVLMGLGVLLGGARGRRARSARS